MKMWLRAAALLLLSTITSVAAIDVLIVCALLLAQSRD
jgi:hypothetical protein